jgi:hypothetical protein
MIVRGANKSSTRRVDRHLQLHLPFLSDPRRIFQDYRGDSYGFPHYLGFLDDRQKSHIFFSSPLHIIRCPCSVRVLLTKLNGQSC